MSTVKHHVAHHFRDHNHEYESSKQGIWLFMCTEVLMFGAILVAFFYYQAMYPESWKEGAELLDWTKGAANTIVLLTSSLTMALAIYFIRVGKRQAAIMNLVITLICGCIFMGIKYMEYSHKFHMGIFPGKFFEYSAQTADLNLYVSFYFLLTGLHGIHVLLGMGLITWILIRIMRGHYGPEHWTGVEGVGIFWHLVDLVWIYLFPILYLI
ncbi:MAG: cytochrome C oxidase subunit III [Bdellovibrionaceae bacterium]|nr:cytochrome C oxidase subunit III [Pseudobdellovibrionaceae bacterium]